MNEKQKNDEIRKRYNIDVAKALEVLFTSEYLDKKKLYWHNFVRGIFFGVGSLVGATVVIGLVVWILSLFNTVPLVGPIVQGFRHSIEQRDNQK